MAVEQVYELNGDFIFGSYQIVLHKPLVTIKRAAHSVCRFV